MCAFFSSVYDTLDSDDARHGSAIGVSGAGSSDEESLADSEESEDDSDSGSGSQSESGSDDDEDWGSSSDSDSDDEAPKGREYFLKKDFLKGGNDNSDSEDEKKVVKSAKEKYIDEIESLIDQIETFSMVEEWIKLNSEFEKLLKLIPKHSQFGIAIPRNFVKVLCAVDDSINNQSKEALKLLPPSQSKALTMVKQKVKKEMKNYTELIDLYRSDPEAFESMKDTLAADDDEDDSQTQQEASLAKSSANAGIFHVILSILESRGKKNVDLKEQISELEELLASEKNSVYENLTILMLLISLRFDLHSKAQFMPLEAWKSTYDEITQLLDLLEANQDFVITEAAKPNEDITSPPEKGEDGKIRIVGSIATLIDRLSEELNGHLLQIDPNSNEYILRLKDEVKLYSLVVRGEVYYTRVLSKDSYSSLEGDQLTRLIVRRLDFIYYKPVDLIILSELNAWKLLNNSDVSIPKITNNENANTNELIDELCKQVSEYSQSSVQKKKALLMQSYYYSTCDEFDRAQTILKSTNMSALPIEESGEVTVQLLFNRAISQLGLSAFRLGLIDESRRILQDIATSSKIRELLGQSNNRSLQSSQPIQVLTNDGETITIGGERHIPFHMHINIQLLETVYYITSLLIEIPVMALTAYQNSQLNENGELKLQQSRKSGGSKTFRRVLEYAVRQYFRGPAEDARDSVILSALDLIQGHWQKIILRFSQLNIWATMPGLEKSSEEKVNKIMSILEKNIKEVSLKTWIYCEAGILKTYPINRLSQRFDLPSSDVLDIVSTIISKDNVGASLKVKSADETIVVFNDKTRGTMAEALKVFDDKISSFVERNDAARASLQRN